MKFLISKNTILKKGKMFEKHNAAVLKAMGVVGLAMLQDIVNKEPKPPFEHGFLRGSQFMYVEGKGGDVGKFNSGAPASVGVEFDKVTVQVGLNTPYAAAQHENLMPSGSWMPGRFTEAGTPKSTKGIGGKFVEKKLHLYKERYKEIFVRKFKEFFK